MYATTPRTNAAKAPTWRPERVQSADRTQGTTVRWRTPLNTSSVPDGDETGADQPREHAGTVLLARDGREAADLPEDKGAQCRQEGAEQRVVEFHPDPVIARGARWLDGVADRRLPAATATGLPSASATSATPAAICRPASQPAIRRESPAGRSRRSGSATHYLASPTAFITVPMAASSLAMNAAKSACCAHSVP